MNCTTALIYQDEYIIIRFLEEMDSPDFGLFVHVYGIWIQIMSIQVYFTVWFTYESDMQASIIIFLILIHVN